MMFANNNFYKRKHALLKPLLSVLLIVLWANPACAQILLPGIDPGGELNKMVEIFRDSVNNSAGIIVGPARTLLFNLLMIDIAWTCINWILDETDMQAIFGTFVKKAMYTGIMLGLIGYSSDAINAGNIMDNRNWVATIPNSFAAVGNIIAADQAWTGSINSSAPGTNITLPQNNLNAPSRTMSIGEPDSMALNPGSILNGGIGIAFAFLGKVLLSFISIGSLMPWNILANLLILIVALVVCFCIIMMFALLAADLTVNFIEAYICMAIGIFLMGLSGSRWTMANINTFLAYLFGLGLRILINISVYSIGVKMIMMTINNNGGINSVPISGQNNGAWNVVIETLGVVFIFFMLVKNVPDIAAGMASNSPMLTAGDGLKAAASGLRGGMQGAAVSGQVLGAGMSAGGRAMMGKSLTQEKGGGGGGAPKVGSKAAGGQESEGKQVSPPSKKPEKEFKNASGLGKDLKTFAKNVAFRPGSTTRNMHEARKVSGAKAMGGVVARSMGAKEGKSKTQNAGNIAKMTGGRALNLIGKGLSLAGRSMDPSSKKDGNGKWTGSVIGGNVVGKTIGSGLSKISGSAHLGSDKPGINYISTVQAGMPE